MTAETLATRQVTGLLICHMTLNIDVELIMYYVKS